jgi:membrane protease YdiL (CAAX protease family)
MLEAGGIVAAFALPVGFLGWVIARRQNQPLLPPWKPWRVPWGAFEAVAAFAILAVVVPYAVLLGLTHAGFYQEIYGPEFPSVSETRMPAMEASAAVAGVPAAAVVHESLEVAAELRRLWAGSFAIVMQVALFFLACRTLYPTWRWPPQPGLGTCLLLSIAAWALLTPLVLAFNFGVNIVFTMFDLQPDAHSLTKLGGRPLLDSLLFLFQACVAAPIIEELLFRGVILSWVLGGRKPSPAPDAPPSSRPWVVMAFALLFTLPSALSNRFGPTIFAVILAAGLVLVVDASRSKRRTASAIYSSAAFFAMVHSAIWPSPIPLFLLGLGLGWLTVRTRSVLVPAIVHGLFNAVSAVFVLRGGAS